MCQLLLWNHVFDHLYCQVVWQLVRSPVTIFIISRLIFRLYSKGQIVDLVKLWLISFANIGKWFLVMDLEVISIKLNTEKLFINFVDGLDIIFNIGFVFVSSLDSSIKFLVGIVDLEQFSIVIVKIVLSLFWWLKMAILLGRTSISCKQAFIFSKDTVDLTNSERFDPIG